MLDKFAAVVRWQKVGAVAQLFVSLLEKCVDCKEVEKWRGKVGCEAGGRREPQKETKRLRRIHTCKKEHVVAAVSGCFKEAPRRQGRERLGALASGVPQCLEQLPVMHLGAAVSGER